MWVAEAVASDDVPWDGAGVAAWQFSSDAGQSSAWSLGMARAVGAAALPDTSGDGSDGRGPDDDDVVLIVLITAAALVVIVLGCYAAGVGRDGRCWCLPSKGDSKSTHSVADQHNQFRGPTASDIQQGGPKPDPGQPYHPEGVKPSEIDNGPTHGDSQPYKPVGVRASEIGAGESKTVTDQTYAATGVNEDEIDNGPTHSDAQPYQPRGAEVANHPRAVDDNDDEVAVASGDDEGSSERHDHAAGVPSSAQAVDSADNTAVAGDESGDESGDVAQNGTTPALAAYTGPGSDISRVRALASPSSVVSPMSGTSDEVATAMDVADGANLGLLAHGGARRALLKPLNPSAGRRTGSVLPGAIGTPVVTPAALPPRESQVAGSAKAREERD